MDNLDRDILMTDRTLQIRDKDITLVENGVAGEAGFILRIVGNKIQLGSGSRDQDIEILGSNGGVIFDAGLAALRLTTTDIIGSGQAYPLTTPTVLASNASYNVTAAQMISGLIVDNTGTGGIVATLPTVAAVVALIPGWVVGTSFLLWYKNTGNQTMTLTVDASAQWTMTGTMTAATTTTRVYMCIIASAVTGTVYSLGTFAE